MKWPRIPIWSPLVATLALIVGLAAEAYPELVEALNDSTIGRKAPDIALIKRAFTIKSPLEIEEPYIQRRVINDGIRGLHRQTYVRVGRQSGEGYKKITDNSAAIGAIVPPSAITEAVRIVDAAQIYESEQGRQFDLAGTQYHVIATRFPLTQAELQGNAPYTGRIVLVTNLDLAAEKTRQILALLGTNIFATIGISVSASIALLTIPIIQINRNIKRGQSISIPWWYPSPIADLAATLESDLLVTAQYKTNVILEKELTRLALVKAEDYAQQIEDNQRIWRHDLLSTVKGVYDMFELLDIIGFTVDDSEYAPTYEMAKSAAASCYKLVDETRKLGDLTTTLRLVPTKVKDVFDQLRITYSKDNVVFHIVDDSAKVLIDDSQFTLRAMTNLINNAIRYSDPPNELVDVMYREKDGNGYFMVKDNGIGISAAGIEKITNGMGEGVRLNPQMPGSGLGLYSVRRILQAHGGNLSIKSRLAEGSIFIAMVKAA